MALKVAVIGGGSSEEAEISRVSAEESFKAVSKSHEAKYLEFDHALPAKLVEYLPDVVLPVLHGPHGEDGTIQGLLSSMQFPFVGSDLHASALAMDKHASKLLFHDAGLPVLEGVKVSSEDYRDRINDIHDQLGQRLVVKPINQGSALGVTLLPNGGDLLKALEDAFLYSSMVLVEPFVTGREITVGVLDLYDDETIALPVIDILVNKNEWYDFTNRYTTGKSEHVIPPRNMDQETLRTLSEIAVEAHSVLGCNDLSRSDYIVTDTGEAWLLEVNTIPGMTPTSLYPDAARAYGIEFPMLMSKLVESGYQRGVR